LHLGKRRKKKQEWDRNFHWSLMGIYFSSVGRVDDTVALVSELLLGGRREDASVGHGDVVRKGHGDRVVLAVQELVCDDILAVLFDAVLVQLALLDLSEVPCDQVRSSAEISIREKKKRGKKRDFPVMYLVTIVFSRLPSPMLKRAGVNDTLYSPMRARCSGLSCSRIGLGYEK